jgi:GTP1/Obg family GTP-binding protein
VRASSRPDHRADRGPLRSSHLAQELFGRIHEIKRKAEESETMVQEICSDIKSLDYAKKYAHTCLIASCTSRGTGWIHSAHMHTYNAGT